MERKVGRPRKEEDKVHKSEEEYMKKGHLDIIFGDAADETF